jgi:putative N6-adenine-specific DNA methylase
MEEQEENEEADIRSFTFHRHDVFEEKKERRSREPREPREPRESRESRSPKGARFSKPGKNRFERNDKRDFGKKRNRFDNDDED